MTYFTVDRYTHLAKAYTQLADKFQKLDVDHMTLKEKVIPVLKMAKAYKRCVEQLQQEKAALLSQVQMLSNSQNELNEALKLAQIRESRLMLELEGLKTEKNNLAATLQNTQAQYDAIAPLAALLEPDFQSVLAEAETQMELVEATLAEIETDGDPNLKPDEVKLLQDLHSDPGSFIASVTDPEQTLAPMLEAGSPEEAGMAMLQSA
jgi:chromosome segregation ATPase